MILSSIVLGQQVLYLVVSTTQCCIIIFNRIGEINFGNVRVCQCVKSEPAMLEYDTENEISC